MYRRSPGRRDERPFTGQYVAGQDFDPPWRSLDARGPPHWNDAHLREGPPNNWGRYNKEFIPHGDRRPPSSEKTRRSPPEYSGRQRDLPGPPPHFGYAERRRLSPKAFDEMQQVPRERLPSPASNFDHHRRHTSPKWARKEYGVGHPDRPESGRDRGYRGDAQGDGPRDPSFGHQQERRPERMEHRNYQVEHSEHCNNRSQFSDRLQPKRSDFRDHRLDKRSRDMGHYEEHGGPQRPYSRSPGHTPVIVEHDHGISQHGGINRAGGGDGRDHLQHTGPPQDRSRRELRHDVGELSRMEPPPKRRRTPPPRHHSPSNVRERHKEPLEDRGFPPHLEKRNTRACDVDLRPDRVNRGDYPVNWQQQRPDFSQPRGNARQEVALPKPMFQNTKSNVNREAPSSAPRADGSERETLKIKVDMSRSAGQDSSFSHNSDRQLSLDLVNVGRQRLDFLPMLEHSGTFRETPMHTGTFAQEIITLVHQVKETYFKGDNVTLNDRFATVMTNTPEEEQEAPVDRRVNVSVPETMPIFSKIENMQAQRRPQSCGPGDLRHDLERRRQERLEGVKVTISGANFSQAVPESAEDECVFVEEERTGVEDKQQWTEDHHEEQRQWGGQMHDMHQRMPGPNRRNFKQRFNHPGVQPGPYRRQYHNHANGSNW